MKRPTNAVLAALIVLGFAQFTALAAHGTTVKHSAFSPRDTNPAVPEPPVLAYNGLGFAYFQNGTLYAIGRSGTRHWSDPTGHVVQFTYDFTLGQTLPSPLPLVVDPTYDVRGAAGGLSPSGAVIFFYQRNDPSTRVWKDMWAARWINNQVTKVQIPVDGDGSFSAYGPLVVLPGGRLLQSVYGWNRHRYRVRVLSSDDDGQSWTVHGIVDSNYVFRPTETAIAFVKGKTASTSTLIAVTKSERGPYTSYLTQYVSHDGGAIWHRVGDITVTVGTGTVSPWIAPLSGGRLALVWPDRTNDVLCLSIAKASTVLTDPSAWPAPRWIYRSRLWGHEGQNHSDFGYPSIASKTGKDSDTYVMFYDSHNGDSGKKTNRDISAVDIMVRPLLTPDIRG
ncbi:MAG: sialidase family protein [Actinomycetota bacterium]